MQNLHRSNLEGPGHGAAGSQVIKYCMYIKVITVYIYIYYNIHIYIYLHTSVMDCSGSKFKPQGTADVLAYDNCYSISHLIVGYYCVA